MKKNKILKYVIFVFAFVISFFMLSKGRVSALETFELNSKVYLELTLENDEYTITGSYHTCGDDASCLASISGSITIPGTYNDKKIVAIGDSADMASGGVFDSLKDVIMGTVTVSENIRTIGVRAFYGFSGVSEIKLAESVTLIKDYAFEDSGLQTLYINRYESSEIAKVTEISSVNAFASTANLTKIVFPNYALWEYYKNDASGYNSLDKVLLNKFTFKVEYVYHFDDNECNVDNCVTMVEYYGNEVKRVPVATPATGLEFVGWFAKSTGDEVVVDSVVKTENNVFDIEVRWDLKDPIVTIGSYFNNQLDDDNTIIYSGRDKSLDIRVNVSHELLSEADFQISYKWQKVGLITSDLDETSNVYKLVYAGDKAGYVCYVTVSYLGYDKIVDVSLEAQILKRDLIINVNDNVTKYGTYVGAGVVHNSYFVIDSSTSLADDEIVKSEGVVADLYTDNNADLSIGTYEKVLEVFIGNIGYEDSNVNYVDNYNIVYVKGDLVIEPKEIIITLTENIVFEYGDVELLSFVQNDVVYGGISKELTIGYNRKNPSVNTVGEYDIVNISVSDPNYEASFSASGSGKVVILPKEVDVEWDVDSNLVYDSNEKEILASYENIEGQKVLLVVEITDPSNVNAIVNAGTYEVTAKMRFANGNYKLNNTVKSIVVEKAESDFIGNNSQTVVYNGFAQKVDVSLNHNEGVLVLGDYSLCKNAHVSSQTSCAITVSVEETLNYKALTETFYLRIKPYSLIVEPELFEIPYGTAVGISNLRQVVKGVNNEDVLVYFSKEGSSSELSVGEYNIATAYLIGNPNYNVTLKEGSGVNKINIVPAEVEIRFFFYENLVYDGKVKDIKIKVDGTSDDVGLQVDYNGKSVIKNAGQYRINVSLTNDNYRIVGDDYLEFSIAKANYDLSHLKLDDKKVKFNFKSHVISLEGDLPLGVSAHYTIDGNTGNGTYLPFDHEVIVSFTGDFENYNYVEPIKATLYIDMTWVFVTLGSVLGAVILAVVSLILMLKYGVIKFTNKVQRKRLRKVISKNRAILSINEMFRNKKEAYEKAKEEEIIIEEDVKFVKNPVEVPQEEIITLSFVDKLFRSDIITKQYYSDVKNELLSYEGVVSKIKRNFETFYVNNVPIAKFDVDNGELQVYFALDPVQYRKEEYGHKNVSRNKDFVAVPLKLTVNSIESLRHAKMFVRIIRKREKLKFSSTFIRNDYVAVYTAKDRSFSMFKKSKVKRGSKESLED